MRLYDDNKAALRIAKNIVFHKSTKHIEVGCHIVCKKLEEKIIVAKHVSSRHQLAHFLTKSHGRTLVDFICDKMGMYDIYSNLRGVLKETLYWFSPTLPMRLDVLCIVYYILD